MPAVKVTFCGVFQLAVVKVRLVGEAVTSGSPPLFSAIATVTFALGLDDSETADVPVLPCWTVSVVGLVTTDGADTAIATGFEVVVWPRLSVATAVIE